MLLSDYEWRRFEITGIASRRLYDYNIQVPLEQGHPKRFASRPETVFGRGQRSANHCSIRRD